MAIIAKGFEQCPVGLHPAKVKAIESFTHDAWGERVKFTFETDKVGKEGQTLSVFHEASLNLSSKAKLSGIIESITGRLITPDERKEGFNVETLIGMTCEINVKHKLSQAGNEYAYVDAILTDNGNHQQTTPPASPEVNKVVDEGGNLAETNALLQEAVEDDIPF